MYQLQLDELLDNNAAAQVVGGLRQVHVQAVVRSGSPGTATPSSRCPATGGRSCCYRTDLFRAARVAASGDVRGDASRGPGAQPRRRVGNRRRHGARGGLVRPADLAEHIALANDCQLTTDGDVTLDSKECVEAADFYNSLIRNYGAAGSQDTDDACLVLRRTRGDGVLVDVHARRAGRAAQRRCPTARRCAASLTFLVENTGVVQALQGQRRRAGRVRRSRLWAILRNAAPERRSSSSTS